jgi:hypothetical protein
MNESKPTVNSLDVRLKPFDTSAHPRAVSYTKVGVAQRIAYLDFGFIEPARLLAVARGEQDGASDLDRLWVA